MDIKLFVKGWKRRNLCMLDAAGCPKWLAKKRCPILDNWGWYLANDARIGKRVADELWEAEMKRLRRAYLPVGLGNPSFIQRCPLDMTIKAADVRKSIEEMEVYNDAGRPTLK